MTAVLDEPAIRQRLKDDFLHYAPRCLRIRTKPGRVLAFILNKSQAYLHQVAQRQLRTQGYVRIIVLKGRQQGISTYIGGRFYWRATHRKGVRVFILAHETEATDNLFNMVDRSHEHCPAMVRPATDANNAKELAFSELDSGYKLGTAGTKGAGRSQTIQLFHSCLSPDTLIVSGETGRLLRMGDMQLGDVVVTHTGAGAPVSVISRQDKPARAITVRSLCPFPLVATDEHRFWTPQGWRELRELRAGDEIGYPLAVIEAGAELQPFRLPDSVRPQGGGAAEVGPSSVFLNYVWGRVLGLYLAEGCIHRQRKAKGGQPASVMFAVHRDEVPRVLEWLAPLWHCHRSINVGMRAPSKTALVTVYGRSFATFVESLCGATDSKRLPWLWNRCGPEFPRGLVHGYLAGDGHFSPQRDRRICATSVRSAITVGMRDALAVLGYGWASIAHKGAAWRDRRNEKEAFILKLAGPGVDRLSAELGKPCVQRQRNGTSWATSTSRIADGYAWLRIATIGEPVMQPVIDFEVDHPDHSYCTVHGATHNSEAGSALSLQGKLEDPADTPAFASGNALAS